MRTRRTVVVLLAVVAVAAIAIFLFRRSSGKKEAEAQRNQAQAAARAIPVVAAPVQRRDVPIYLDGLGNVTAFKTVTVRSQVDGRLEQVLFQEGEPVKAGELLARMRTPLALPRSLVLLTASAAIPTMSSMPGSGAAARAVRKPIGWVEDWAAFWNLSNKRLIWLLFTNL